MNVHSKLAGGCSSTNHRKHDVFISFRGDTRNNFTDHLHKALQNANISTFLDEEEIETGGVLKLEFRSAIETARAFIIVLSKNYANSSRCLDELVLILEQYRASDQIVFPILYHVDPAHFRKQEGTIGLAIAEHKQKMERETNADKRRELGHKIDGWIKALTEVSNLKGEDINGRLETEFIEEIVEDIHRRLHVPLMSASPEPIGMKDSIEVVTSWLKGASSDTVDILTICGMSGIGKTTLAKYIHGLHSHEFVRSSYIEDISRRCAGESSYYGLLSITQQLYGDISKKSSIRIHDLSKYTRMIENVVAHNKVFLVLDDIDSLDQLEAILGKTHFHQGSKIIITTRNTWLTERCALFKTEVSPKHKIHELKGLDDTKSRELFCSKAFASNHPKAGFEQMSEKIVKYCSGHPKTLKYLGESLYKKCVAHWEEVIEGLGKHPIDNELRKSYDSLPSGDDKELFKYIACFFVGIDRDFSETILKACKLSAISGITNLIERCILSIGCNNELVMHKLIQEMGRFVVHEESSMKPWKRSHVWCHEDSLEVLKHKKGTRKVLGLTLDMKKLMNEKLHESFELETDALSNMPNLMLLQLNHVKMNGSYENFPKKLRWLCMHGFRMKSIPFDLPMENLVALDLSYSNIELFDISNSDPQQPHKRQKFTELSLKYIKKLGSLKNLNLSFCEKLCRLGGFEELPILERLVVANCIGLVEVCESIGGCNELVLIDMSNCTKLENVPRSIGKLGKLQTLLPDGCIMGESQIENRDIDSSEMFKASTLGISTNPLPLPFQRLCQVIRSYL